MFTCGCHRGHADQGSRSTFFYVVHRTSKFWILWNYRVHLKVMWSWNTWKILKLKIFIILEFAIMLLVVKSKCPGQQNHVCDTETRLSGNPDVVMDTLFLHIMRQILRSRLHTRLTKHHTILQSPINAVTIATTNWATILWVLKCHTDCLYHVANSIRRNIKYQKSLSFSVPYYSHRE